MSSKMTTLKKSILSFTLMGALLMAEQTVAQGIYREPNQELLQGKYYTIVQDNGDFKKALRDSDGNYLFSEKGAGVKPLVFIGTTRELIKFLYENRTLRIVNKIATLPSIYIRVTYFENKPRFKSITPVHDAIQQITQTVKSFIPNPLSDSITNRLDIRSALEDVKTYLDADSSNEANEKPNDSKLIYLKISYLKDKGAIKIGEKSITFGSILYHFLKLDKVKDKAKS